MGKYKVKKGDSWIKIANQNGLNLIDLFRWNNVNPASKESLRVLNPGDELYLSDPYVLEPAFIQAEAPKDYVQFGAKGKELIDKYALAVKQGSLSFDRVPEVYKTAVYQKMITNKTDRAANTAFNVGLNAALLGLDPVGFIASTASQKGLAYANDALSGRNEYKVGDLLGYTPIMGTKYTAEHPLTAIGVDVLGGIGGGYIIRNLPQILTNIAQNGRAMVQNALRTTGLQRQTIIFPGKQQFGTVYQEGTKAAGKTGTVRASHVGGYSPVTSSKGSFGNQSSGNATYWIVSDANIPVAPVTPVPSNPVLPPVLVPPPTEPPVRVPPEEDKHIYEQQAFSRWQLPNPTGQIIPMQPGTGVFTLTGEAPVGPTVYDQALTNESLDMHPVYMPRVSVYQPGSITGTPSHWKSGLGITWTSSSPGNLIP